MTPSEMVCRAWGAGPRTFDEAIPGLRCSLCGRVGDEEVQVAPWKPPSTFTDHTFLIPGRRCICGYCARVIEQSWLRKLQNAVITPKGIYSLTTDAERASLWLGSHDLTPPFAVCLSGGNSISAYHYVWRTPVTLSARLIHVNLDDRIYAVRTPLVAAAVRACETLRSAAPLLKTLGIPAAAARSPLIGLSRKPGRSGSAPRVRHEIASNSKLEGPIRDAVCVLQSLGPGELLAMSALTHLDTKPPAPLRAVHYSDPPRPKPEKPTSKSK